jgi:hypothetical protein
LRRPDIPCAAQRYDSRFEGVDRATEVGRAYHDVIKRNHSIRMARCGLGLWRRAVSDRKLEEADDVTQRPCQHTFPRCPQLVLDTADPRRVGVDDKSQFFPKLRGIRYDK